MHEPESATVHPTASVDPRARLGRGVSVGAYAVIAADVEIGAGSRIGAHAVLLGPMRMGRGNVVHPHACLGGAPQDLGYRDEPTRLEIGERNVIREFATLHRASTRGSGVTRVGNDNLFMASCHIGHDCDIGDGATIASGVMLGGHVSVGDGANLGGLCAVHQFVRIGRQAMIGGASAVDRDIPPFALAAGNRARLHGLNRRGLRRAGLAPEAVRALHHAYRRLFRSGLRLEAALAELRESGPATPEVEHLLAFMAAPGRGVTR